MLTPRHAGACHNLGILLCDQNNVEEAIDLFNKAIDIDANDANTYYHLALAVEKKGDVKEAIQILKKAIEIDSKNINAYDQLAKNL